MALKFVVARYENDHFDDFLGKYINDYQHVFVQNEIANSIFQKYNMGIQFWKDQGLQDDDVIVFCHADVKILDPDFAEKVQYAFSNIPGLGVAGVIGSTEIDEQGGWWLTTQDHHRGHVVQWKDDTESSKYHMIRKEGNFLEMCVVDGLCMFVSGSLAKTLNFDETTYPESYDFYDYDYCLSSLSMNRPVAVLDILLEHRSAGTGIYKQSWEMNKQRFLNKWKSLGVQFPLKMRIKE